MAFSTKKKNSSKTKSRKPLTSALKVSGSSGFGPQSTLPKRAMFANTKLGVGLTTSFKNPGAYGTARQFGNKGNKGNYVEEDF